MSETLAVGQLQGEMKSISKAVDILHDSNDKRKKETNDLTINMLNLQHMVEEINTTVNGVAGAMEEFKQGQIRIEKKVDDIDGRVKSLENSAFNSGKFWAGVVSTKGITVACIIFGILFCIATIVLALNAPETLPQFFMSVKQ
jgi:hypothetical protein